MRGLLLRKPTIKYFQFYDSLDTTYKSSWFLCRGGFPYQAWIKKHQDKNNIFIFVFLNKDRFNQTRIVLLSMALFYKLQ